MGFCKSGATFSVACWKALWNDKLYFSLYQFVNFSFINVWYDYGCIYFNLALHYKHLPETCWSLFVRYTTGLVAKVVKLRRDYNILPQLMPPYSYVYCKHRPLYCSDGGYRPYMVIYNNINCQFKMKRNTSMFIDTRCETYILIYTHVQCIWGRYLSVYKNIK